MIVSNLNIGITLRDREALKTTDNKEDTMLSASRSATSNPHLGSMGKTPIFENHYYNGHLSSGKTRAAQKTANSSPLLTHSGGSSEEGCQQVLRRYSEIWDSIPSSFAKPIISPAFSYQSAPFCKDSDTTYII